MERAAPNLSRLLTGPSAEPHPGAHDLLPALYDDLRRLAAHYMANETASHTLQPTALVHEAYLRLARSGRLDLTDRARFFTLAATTMRRILVDHARRRAAARRGANPTRHPLDPFLAALETRSGNLLALDDALRDLEARDPRQARIVELRFFAGMTTHEIAAALCISARTVEREWTLARAWLRQQLLNRTTQTP